MFGVRTTGFQGGRSVMARVGEAAGGGTGAAMTYRVHLPSLAVEIPDGWSVTEEATITPPSGTAIRVHLDHVAEDCDAASVADRMEAAARASVAGMNNVTASSVPLPGGRVGHQRRFGFESDAIAAIARIVTLIDGDLALTLTASWVAGDDRADREVDDALASIRLLSRPVAAISGGRGQQERPPRAKRPPVDRARWPPLWADPF